MATARLYYTCHKPSAPMHCTGCDEYFCNKDFRGHREGMFGDMDKIVESRNQLQEAINHLAQGSDQQSPVISEIDRWEKTTIRKIQQVATQAREQALQLLNGNRATIHNGFKSFSQELAALRESEDFVETDLARLNQMITQFRLDINQSTQPVTIQLHTEQSEKVNWDSLIYVEELRTRNKPQRQPPTTRKFLR